MIFNAVIKKRLKHFQLDLELGCERGQTLCVVGPSGSGKTTLLRLLAGLERADAGFLRLGDDVWLDTSRSIRLPPRRRSVGLVFQDYSLIPHMTLWQNALFAAKSKRLAEDLLEMFGIAHLKEMRPSRMSGGERQRGALCQALARMPGLLLLDEPFSALDLENRLHLRRALKQIQQDAPLCMIHVTHDLNEAMYLGDEIIAVNQGRSDRNWLERQLNLLRREQSLVVSHAPPQVRFQYEKASAQQ
jgi:molybdate transport system ATP-binding protein